MISYMILKISYFQYDIILNIISNIIADPFLALFSYDIIYNIIYISYDFASDISNSWYEAPLISVTQYIIAIRYHGFSDITSYIMAPAARRDGAGWGRAPSSPTCWAQWGGCSAERWLPWSRAVQAPDSDDIWASRMVLDFKMDSCWKLPVAEWRRRVRPESTCTATSTWKLEFWVRADCGASEPGAAEAASANI
jgi:hypothetical protein